MARTFDRKGQLSLVGGAISRDSPGHNLKAFGEKRLQNEPVFVINFQLVISAESASFLAMK